MKRLLCMLLAFLPLFGALGCKQQDKLQKMEQITSSIVTDFQNYKLHGRTLLKEHGIFCDETTTGISFHAYLEGSVKVQLSVNADTYFTVYVDGQRSEERIYANSLTSEIEIASFTEPGKHTIELIKQSEACKSICLLKSVSFTGYFMERPADKNYCIAYIGDSITAGYGVYYDPNGINEPGSTVCQDGTKTYAYLTAQALDADYITTCRSGIGISAGHTGYMMDEYFGAASFCRADTTKYEPTRLPDLVVINLGTNDAMGSDDGVAAKLPGLIDLVRSTYGENVPIIFIHGMMNNARWAAMDSVIQSKYGGESGGIYDLQTPVFREGGNGHPSLDNHCDGAELLTQFIKDKDLLK